MRVALILATLALGTTGIVHLRAQLQQPTPTEITFDNTALPGITVRMTGPNWQTVTGVGYRGSYVKHTVQPNNEAESYTVFHTDHVVPATYDVFVTWQPDAQNATSVLYTIWQPNATGGMKRIFSGARNQQRELTSFPLTQVWDGVRFVKLGTATITNGSRVWAFVGSRESKQFNADAVKLVPQSAPQSALSVSAVQGSSVVSSSSSVPSVASGSLHVTQIPHFYACGERWTKGQEGKPILTMKLRAEGEDIVLEQLDTQIMFYGAQYDFCGNKEIGSNVEMYTMYRRQGSQILPIARAPGRPNLVNGSEGARFIFSEQLTIASGTEEEVIIVPTIGQNAVHMAPPRTVFVNMNENHAIDPVMKAVGKQSGAVFDSLQKKNIDIESVYPVQVHIPSNPVMTNAQEMRIERAGALQGGDSVPIGDYLKSFNYTNNYVSTVPKEVRKGMPLSSFTFTAAEDGASPYVGSAFTGVQGEHFNEVLLSGLVFTVDAQNVSFDPDSFNLSASKSYNNRIHCVVYGGAGDGGFAEARTNNCPNQPIRWKLSADVTAEADGHYVLPSNGSWLPYEEWRQTNYMYEITSDKICVGGNCYVSQRSSTSGGGSCTVDIANYLFGSRCLDSDLGKPATGKFYVRCGIITPGGEFCGSREIATIARGSSEILTLHATVLQPKIDESRPAGVRVFLENSADPAQFTTGIHQSHILWFDGEHDTSYAQHDWKALPKFAWLNQPGLVIEGTRYGTMTIPNDPPVPGTITFDDVQGDESRFRADGNGWSIETGKGYLGTQRRHAAQTSNPGYAFARYFAHTVTTGEYDVYATWDPTLPVTNAAGVIVGQPGKNFPSIAVNQRLDPATFAETRRWEGSIFAKITTAPIIITDGSTVRVYITARETANFVADAVKLVPRGTAPVSSTSSALSVSSSSFSVAPVSSSSSSSSVAPPSSISSAGSSSSSSLSSPAPFCGDGMINQPGEQCDDGNTTNEDSCSGQCLIEASSSSSRRSTVASLHTSLSRVRPQFLQSAEPYLRYQLTVKNTGESRRENASIWIALPSGFNLVRTSLGVARTHPDCTVTGGSVRCTLPPIDAGASVERQIAFSLSTLTTCANILEYPYIVVDGSHTTATGTLTDNITCPTSVTKYPVSNRIRTQTLSDSTRLEYADEAWFNGIGRLLTATQNDNSVLRYREYFDVSDYTFIRTNSVIDRILPSYISFNGMAYVQRSAHPNHCEAQHYYIASADYISFWKSQFEYTSTPLFVCNSGYPQSKGGGSRSQYEIEQVRQENTQETWLIPQARFVDHYNAQGQFVITEEFDKFGVKIGESTTPPPMSSLSSSGNSSISSSSSSSSRSSSSSASSVSSFSSSLHAASGELTFDDEISVSGITNFLTWGPGWSTVEDAGYQEHHRLHAAQPGSLLTTQAGFYTHDLPNGEYDVFTAWQPHAENAYDVNVVVWQRLNGESSYETRIIWAINQQNAPAADIVDGGVPFKKVGRVTITKGDEVVVLIRAPNSKRYTVDAVKIVPTGAPQSSSSIRTSSSSSNTLPSSSSSSSVSSTQAGCVIVLKEAFDATNALVHPTPSFSFTLDGTTTRESSQDGRATFIDVPPGIHAIIEEPRHTWEQTLVDPLQGTVTVQPGPVCATVVFRNKQQAASSSSNSSSYGATMIGPWFPRFSTIDTGQLAGKYASIAVGSDNLPILAYYDQINGDLKVAKCTTPSCESPTITVLDTSGNVGLFAGIALDGNGYPVISYYDQTNKNLKIARCRDRFCTPAIASIRTIDSVGDVGRYSAIVIPSDNLPVISYYSYLSVANGTLKVAKCLDTDCTSTNRKTVFNTGHVGPYTDITIGADGNPVISYMDYTWQRLKYAKCNDAQCSNAFVSPVHNESRSQQHSGMFSQIAMGQDGLPVLAYYNNVARDLEIAKCINPSCSANTIFTSVDGNGGAGNAGEYVSMVIQDGNPLLAYHDGVANTFKIAQCNDATCAQKAIVTLEGNPATWNAQDIGLYTSLAVGPDGIPVVAYYGERYEYSGGQQVNRTTVLKIVKLCRDAACTPKSSSSQSSLSAEEFPADTIVFDDNSPPYTMTGDFRRVQGEGGYNDSYVYHGGGPSPVTRIGWYSDTAFENPVPFDIYATWKPSPGYATDIQYKSKFINENVWQNFDVSVNQKIAPSGSHTWGGVRWQKLGAVTLTGSLSVNIEGPLGAFSVDAVAFVPTGSVSYRSSSSTSCSPTPWASCQMGFTCLATCVNNICQQAAHIDCPAGQQAEYSGACGNPPCYAQCARCVGISSSVTSVPAASSSISSASSASFSSSSLTPVSSSSSSESSATSTPSTLICLAICTHRTQAECALQHPDWIWSAGNVTAQSSWPMRFVQFFGSLLGFADTATETLAQQDPIGCCCPPPPIIVSSSASSSVGPMSSSAETAHSVSSAPSSSSSGIPGDCVHCIGISCAGALPACYVQIGSTSTVCSLYSLSIAGWKECPNVAASSSVSPAVSSASIASTASAASSSSSVSSAMAASSSAGAKIYAYATSYGNAQSYIRPGHTFSHKITIRNTGNAPAYLTLYYTTPPGAAFMSAANCGSTSCVLGTLKPGAIVTKIIAFRTFSTTACNQTLRVQYQIRSLQVPTTINFTGSQQVKC